jgi:AcrR family transcriptional regulator
MARPSVAKPLIDAAALALFAEHGVAATTTREIAQRAGVSEGALYRHYESKEALARSLFLEHYDALGRRFADLAAGRTGFHAKLSAMVAEVCRLFDDNRPLFAFLLLTQHDSLAAGLPAGTANPVEVVRGAVVQAMDAGEIPARDPDLATALIFGAVLQPATFAVYGRLTGRFADRAAALTAAAWRAVS